MFQATAEELWNPKLQPFDLARLDVSGFWTAKQNFRKSSLAACATTEEGLYMCVECELETSGLDKDTRIRYSLGELYWTPRQKGDSLQMTSNATARVLWVPGLPKMSKDTWDLHKTTALLKTLESLGDFSRSDETQALLQNILSLNLSLYPGTTADVRHDVCDRLADQSTQSYRSDEWYKTVDASRYAYQPLGEGMIRILTLRRSHKSKPVECNISLEKLGKQPLYTSFDAVSYAWGEPDFVRYLCCQDGASSLRITPRLEEILRRLAPTDAYDKLVTAKRLCIDAVCINQEDAVERGHQLRLMSKIYRRYTLSTNEVYIKFATAIIESVQPCGVLQCAGAFRGGKGKGRAPCYEPSSKDAEPTGLADPTLRQWPTWVPDWRAGPAQHKPLLGKGTTLWSPAACLKDKPAIEVDGSRLCLPAILVGTVESLSEDFSDDGDFDELQSEHVWWQVALDGPNAPAYDLSSDRVCVRTEDGIYGAAPRGTRNGDRIFLFPRAKTPFILRHQTANVHSLIGDCYLHGAMEGQLTPAAIACLTDVVII